MVEAFRRPDNRVAEHRRAENRWFQSARRGKIVENRLCNSVQKPVHSSVITRGL